MDPSYEQLQLTHEPTHCHGCRCVQGASGRSEFNQCFPQNGRGLLHERFRGIGVFKFVESSLYVMTGGPIVGGWIMVSERLDGVPECSQKWTRPWCLCVQKSQCSMFMFKLSLATKSVFFFRTWKNMFAHNLYFFVVSVFALGIVMRCLPIVKWQLFAS